MTTLVTGSAGHLGEALVRTLRRQGQPARGLDVLPSAWTDQVGSITDRAVVRAALEGVDAVLHTATLHKPHVATHARGRFVEVNVQGTLTLLEEAAAAGVRAFVFTSTTSAFGRALTARSEDAATWITEGVRPVPKNVYGVTKVAAEELCELVARDHGLPCVVLRTSRFFPEEDDDPQRRAAYDDANLKVNELLHRRVDLEDVVQAHVLALERAPELGFRRLIVSATAPFEPADAPALARDAAAVIRARYPEAEGVFAARGWRLYDRLDRVYVNAAAREALGWRPRLDFGEALARLRRGAPVFSALTREVGSKGYHRAV